MTIGDFFDTLEKDGISGSRLFVVMGKSNPLSLNMGMVADMIMAVAMIAVTAGAVAEFQIRV